MVRSFTVEQLRAIMEHKNNIRNISVIAHVDHGKSTLTDSLVQKAGIISAQRAGDLRFTDSRKDEQERGITIKSTGVSLYYELSENELPVDSTTTGFLVNLIDSPGHVDFSSEVTAALRVTDGAVVVVDCVEGVCVQTETVLRQALAERIKPVLMMNKLDRVFLELQLDAEEAYLSLQRTIESVNVVVATYQDEQLGDLTLEPQKGSVAFGSGLQGWGFTLNKFADIYSKKFGIDKRKLLTRLWGDHFFDRETKKWSKTPPTNSSSPYKRGFCELIYKPIAQLVNAIMTNETEKYQRMMSALDIHLTTKENELMVSGGKPLLKAVMKQFLPAADAMLEMIIHHLPSPVVAQRYRVETLYEGPLDDECAEAIRTCDPNGPVMMYISKMVPTADNSRFYAFGRVFSGTVKTGQKVRIFSADPSSSNNNNSSVNNGNNNCKYKSIQRTLLMMGRSVEPLDDCPCGNIVALSGLDQYLYKSGTISTSQNGGKIKDMKFSVSPVVRIAVEPKNPVDLPKLIEGLRRLSKSDPLVRCSVTEAGEHILEATGELHLEICIHDLQEFCGIEIVTSQPVVSFRETVTAKSEVCLSKSPNKLNRVFVTAEPLSEKLVLAIDEKVIVPRPENVLTQANLLVNEYEIERDDTRKLWCFGPDEIGSNLLFDQSHGVSYLHEVRSSCEAAFQWVTKEGVLCGEEMRGIRYNLVDAKLHSDAAHRGGGQVIPAVRRALYASQLSAQPRLLEPIFLVEIQCPEEALGGVFVALNQRRGYVFEEDKKVGTPLYNVKAYLPVVDSFGFCSHLSHITGGKAFPQCVFHHWEVLSDNPLDESTRVGALVLDIRKRKNLGGSVPPLNKFLDKL